MSALAAGALKPVIALAARIGWRIHYSEIIFVDPPCLVLQATPVFPGCSDTLAEHGIVWDVFALMDSITRPGAHQVLTCECGIACDADLHEAIFVSHPDEHTVVWELDIPGLRPALDAAFDSDPGGFVRLIFARDEYEPDIRALLRELQRCGSTPIATRDLAADVHGVKHLHAEFPSVDRLLVDELQPDSAGLALERLLALDADAPWTRETLWPPGTLVELGFFVSGNGHELIRVNGELSRVWPSWYVTRWEVMAAFKAWMSHVQRAFWLRRSASLPEGVGDNEFVLLSEAGRSSCHEAGRRLAAVMRASLEEGKTAPGVTVRYCECVLHAANPAVPRTNENDDT